MAAPISTLWVATAAMATTMPLARAAWSSASASNREHEHPAGFVLQRTILKEQKTADRHDQLFFCIYFPKI
jgi:hypothetical protein